MLGGEIEKDWISLSQRYVPLEPNKPFELMSL